MSATHLPFAFSCKVKAWFDMWIVGSMQSLVSMNFVHALGILTQAGRSIGE